MTLSSADAILLITTYFFQGNIADVRFWNIVRTPAEIAADKDKQLTGSEPGLVGYWKLNEPSGETVFDSSVNHNDGTITELHARPMSASTAAWSVKIPDQSAALIMTAPYRH
jgi:hypothetical protein